MSNVWNMTWTDGNDIKLILSHKKTRSPKTGKGYTERFHEKGKSANIGAAIMCCFL